MTAPTPPPAFMDPAEIGVGRRRPRRNPEHVLQAWVDRFIDKVVLPDTFTSGIDHAGQATDNQRARMAGRGVKFGLPDVFVAQRLNGARCCWIELKRGSALTVRQEGVHLALARAGQSVAVCRSIFDVLLALRAFGFVLHGNADNIAAEYEARVKAKEGEAARSSKPRTAKPRHAGRGITTAMLVRR